MWEKKKEHFCVIRKHQKIGEHWFRIYELRTGTRKWIGTCMWQDLPSNYDVWNYFLVACEVLGKRACAGGSWWHLVLLGEKSKITGMILPFSLRIYQYMTLNTLKHTRALSLIPNFSSAEPDVDAHSLIIKQSVSLDAGGDMLSASGINQEGKLIWISWGSRVLLTPWISELLMQ